MTSLTLTVRCAETAMGESVAVVGSWSDWKVPTIFETSPDQFPKWCGTLELAAADCKGDYYKYVIVKDGLIVRWEDGDNRAVDTLHPQVDDGTFADGGANRTANGVAVVVDDDSVVLPEPAPESAAVIPEPEQPKEEPAAPASITTTTTNANGAANGVANGSAETEAPTGKENEVPSSKIAAGDTSPTTTTAAAVSPKKDSNIVPVIPVVDKIQGDTTTTTNVDTIPAKNLVKVTASASPNKTKAAAGKRKSKK